MEQTKIKKTRAAALKWVRFYSLDHKEPFFIGRNHYAKVGFVRAVRASNGQRVNVSPLTRVRSFRLLKKA